MGEQWEERHGTRTSLLNALTRIEHHIEVGDYDKALATIAAARKTAERNKARDQRMLAEAGVAPLGERIVAVQELMQD